MLTAEGALQGLLALDSLYRTVLEGVLSAADSSRVVQKRLRRVLKYLVTLQDPDGISPATLEKLTNMPTTESVPILNKLRSVIFFERDSVDYKSTTAIIEAIEMHGDVRVWGSFSS